VNVPPASDLPRLVKRIRVLPDAGGRDFVSHVTGVFFHCMASMRPPDRERGGPAVSEEELVNLWSEYLIELLFNTERFSDTRRFCSAFSTQTELGAWLGELLDVRGCAGRVCAVERERRSRRGDANEPSTEQGLFSTIAGGLGLRQPSLECYFRRTDIPSSYPLLRELANGLLMQSVFSSLRDESLFCRFYSYRSRRSDFFDGLLQLLAPDSRGDPKLFLSKLVNIGTLASDVVDRVARRALEEDPDKRLGIVVFVPLCADEESQLAERFWSSRMRRRTVVFYLNHLYELFRCLDDSSRADVVLFISQHCLG